MSTVKHPVVTCDECKHKFKLKPSKIKIEKVTEEVERTYFVCPKCKHRFIVIYKDKELNDNLIKMESIRKKAGKLNPKKKEFKELLDKYNELYERNLKISNQYRKVYGA